MLLEIWKTKRIWVRVYEKLGGEGNARAKSLAVLVELYNTCNNGIIEHNASAPSSVVYDSH